MSNEKKSSSESLSGDLFTIFFKVIEKQKIENKTNDEGQNRVFA